jgi:putative RecB family exonuclease
MSLPVPTTLSPSKISAFKHCALAFRFSVLDGLPEPPSPWASKRTLVHRALEFLFLRPPGQRTPEHALVDLDRARRELADHPQFTGLGLADDDLEAFHRDAAEMVMRYFLLENPEEIRPIGLELRMAVTIDGLTLRGVIDRLELADDGALIVTDYKTGSPPRPGFEQDRLGGVHFYSLLCERMLGRRPARIQLVYLSSEPQVLSTCPSERSATAMRRRAAALYAAVERACQQEDFRPNPGRLCDWCAFRPYCPAYGGDPAEAAALARPALLQSA